MSADWPRHIYISGPMRAIDGFNFPAFFEAEEYLRALYPKADICNPAREDVVRFGLHGLLLEDPTGLLAGRHLQQESGFGEDELRDALGRDLEFICRMCDLIVLLPGWRESKGALAELAACQAIGITYSEYHPQEAQEGPSEVPSPAADQGPTEALEASEGRHSASHADEIRVTSASGGQKGTKLAAFDQISPEVEWLVAEHFGKGARKYDAHNFRKGYPWSLSYSALRRHLADFWAGKEYDVCPDGCTTWEGETSEHGRVCINHTGSLHIVCVIWHAMVLTEFFLHHKHYDDRYHYDATQG